MLGGGQGWNCCCGFVTDALHFQQVWERKAEDAKRDYEKAMKEYSVGGKSESSRT